ncbi:DUF2471 family protein [Pararobbsia silviterrae]|nr:DUF2471 family protein [Pararobbsia silviterrae]
MSDHLDSDLAFDRAASDVRRVVHDIAGRYARRGFALTWRLLHAVEDEALADLGLASRHGPDMLARFARPSDAIYPHTDTDVRLDDAATTPLIFWFALEAFGRLSYTSTSPAREFFARRRLASPHAAHHVRSV